MIRNRIPEARLEKIPSRRARALQCLDTSDTVELGRVASSWLVVQPCVFHEPIRGYDSSSNKRGSGSIVLELDRSRETRRGISVRYVTHGRYWVRIIWGSL